MAKKNKKRVHKTLVEQILDKNSISFEQMTFPTKQEGDVQQIKMNNVGKEEHRIFKTLVLTGNKTGPVVGVIPIDWHLSLKKLAKASGNKKVEMVPLKNLLKTTGYEHGANTPIGIWEKYHYPIYFDNEAQNLAEIIVSSGQIGRSVKVNAEAIANLLGASFTDLKE